MHSNNRYTKLGALTALTVVSVLSAHAQSTMTLPDSGVDAINHSTLIGAAPATEVVHMAIGLRPRYPVEFQAYADSVSNPRSDSYRKWLTPAQIGQQFGVSATDWSNLTRFLTSKGLRITLAANNKMAMLVDGTVTQVQNAFGVQLKKYSGTDYKGRTITFRANTTPLHIPSNLAGPVQCVTGIETYTRPIPRNTTLLTPPLTRGLYNMQPAYLTNFRGQGRTVAVSNFDGFRLTNVPLFCTLYGLPVPLAGAGTNIEVIPCGTPSGPGSPQGEGDLDIQMEVSMAPLANILIYDGSDRLSVVVKEANDNRADVLSESWGWFPSVAVGGSYHTQQLAMTVQGQTYMEATGDDGTTFTGYYPNIEPEILQVGGTVATVDSITGARVSEVGWSGSTGGWYDFDIPFNTRPSWMVGTGVPTTVNRRLNPDIAMHSSGGNPFGGAYTFFLEGTLQNGYAGTSFASPACAGCFTVLEQRLADAGLAPRLGRVQDLIYQQNGRSDIWTDVTVGSNGQLPNGQTSNAGAGWDYVTGFGAPDFDALFHSFQQQVTITSIAPDAISTVIGDYIIGDPTSVSDSDSIYYQIGSNGIPQFGQAAGASVSFTVPNTTAFMTISLAANSGIAGATNMVWLYNWNTGSYDFINATPVNVSGSAKKSIKVRTSDVSSYVGPGGEVDMLLRGHIPIKPFQNTVPNPFTYRIDQLELLVR